MPLVRKILRARDGRARNLLILKETITVWARGACVVDERSMGSGELVIGIE